MTQVVTLEFAARAALVAVRRMKSCIGRRGEESGVIEIYNNDRYWPLSVLSLALDATKRPRKKDRELRKAVKAAQTRFRELYKWMETDEYPLDEGGDDWDEPPYQMDEIGGEITDGYFDDEVTVLKAALNRQSA